MRVACIFFFNHLLFTRLPPPSPPPLPYRRASRDYFSLPSYGMTRYLFQQKVMTVCLCVCVCVMVCMHLHVRVPGRGPCVFWLIFYSGVTVNGDLAVSSKCVNLVSRNRTARLSTFGKKLMTTLRANWLQLKIAQSIDEEIPPLRDRLLRTVTTWVRGSSLTSPGRQFVCAGV